MPKSKSDDQKIERLTKEVLRLLGPTREERAEEFLKSLEAANASRATLLEDTRKIFAEHNRRMRKILRRAKKS